MNRRGLGLFEVLVALGVVAALAIALGNFVGDLQGGRERLAAAMERRRAADNLFTTLEGALATTVVEDARLGSGVRGTAERLEVVARDVPAWRLGDLATREMALDDRQRIVVLGGFGGGEAAGRLRRTGPEGDRDSSLAAVVRFRYHDGTAWRAEFDSARHGAMPRLVEVNLWWPRPGDFDERDDLENALETLDAVGEPDGPGFEDRLGEDGFDLVLDPDLDGGDAVATGIAREDLGGPTRVPDRVRVIAIPDAGPAPEGDDSIEIEDAFETDAPETLP